MDKKLLLSFLIFISFSINESNAQTWGNWGCYDSLLINVGAYCLPDYDPVCACNGETYRNFCFARNDGYQQYYDGICELVDFNITSNPVVNHIELDVIVREEGNVTVHILDWHGKVYYQDFFWLPNRRKYQVPVSNFEQGLYMVLVRYNDIEAVVKKFVKITL